MNSNIKKLGVADIFRAHGEAYRQCRFVSTEQQKVMNHIRACRTAELGGHVEQCDACDFERISYNSCRDRHCPLCQTMVKEQWLNDRKAELLPCGYFHLVFTLPHGLNPIILRNRAATLRILFAAVNETLQAFAGDKAWRLNGRLGFIAVLHTWSQTLMDHFHLHCLIPAGALSADNTRWIAARKSFLFRVKSLAKEFRKRYLGKINQLFQKNKLVFPGDAAALAEPPNFAKLLHSLAKTAWITYAKRPFDGPEQVLEYLGRYTHRIAISNNRILDITDDNKVRFSYRDRAANNEVKTLTISTDEFIRRFLLHVLPHGFVKIRYFGFLANKVKRNAIPLLRVLMNPKAKVPEKRIETAMEIMLRLTGIDLTCCPVCKKGKMVVVQKLVPGIPNTS